MHSKKTVSSPDLFRSRLDQIIDMKRPLAKLANLIDWSVFENEFGKLYSSKYGRPAIPIRLMVGLTYLSRIYDLSDEAVVEMWLDNPYWQYFCGFEYFQHKYPIDPSSLVRFRKRIGEEGVEFLFEHTLRIAQDSGKLTKQHFEKVNVDTTVQEKNVRFPTDARLYHRLLEHLIKSAKEFKIPLRQSYVRLAKKALLKQSQYARATQMKRARKETKKLKTMVGRVVRDIRRKAAPDIIIELHELLSKADRLLNQKRKDKHKLYSIHEPDVECIAKGKAHKKYEFGSKASFVTTSRDNWVVGASALHGNPYDGHTLTAALEQMERLTGQSAKVVFADKGYRGSGYTGSTKVHVVDNQRKRLTRTEKRWRKRRNAIEPIIGHLKSSHRLSRNFLKGKKGDRMNVLLAACGWNLRKLMRILLSLIQNLIFYPENQKQGQKSSLFQHQELKSELAL